MRPKMLVIRIGALGDVCMLVPVVRELQKHFSVDWLIRDCHANVLRFCPELECRIIETNPNVRDAFPFPETLVNQLQQESYDYCLDFSHWPMVSRLVERLRAIPRRAITHDPRQDALLKVNPLGIDLYQPFNHVVEVDPQLHQVEKWLALIQAVSGIDLTPALSLPDRQRPGQALQVFVQAHASKEAKLWPTRHFATVLRSLARKRPVHCFINANPGCFARELTWRLAFSGCRIERVAFDPTLQGLHDQLQKIDFALGCDSGPMHFASLLGVPTVVVYGPYTAREFRPMSRNVSVSPREEHLTAETIPSHQVLAAVERLVEELDSGGPGEYAFRAP